MPEREDEVVRVIVCVDSGALIGLHVTLLTALENLSAGTLELHILHDGIADHEFELLDRTMKSVGKPYRTQRHLMSLDRFRGLRDHMGHGWMAYARLIAPQIVDADRFVYLDADLIVRADLAELYGQDLGPYMLGATTWYDFGHSQDVPFFSGIGFDLSKPYFNSGVLLFDVRKWNAAGMSDRCMEVASEYGLRLPSHDQSILNLLFLDNFAELPKRFNQTLTASRRRADPTNWNGKIIHLISRPKPWDPCGFLNGQSRAWRECLARTAIPGRRDYRWSLATLRKCYRLGSAYRKCLFKRALGLIGLDGVPDGSRQASKEPASRLN